MTRFRWAWTLCAAAATAFAASASAATVGFDFAGSGVSGSVVLTYGAATDSIYPNAFEVTGISGTFSDANASIVNATIGSLIPITHATPEDNNLLAPHDFSRLPVATGLDHGVLSFDNLYWPGGSPQTASDYPGAGGVFDIYGLLFDIGDGRVVNLWSNGADANGVADYGAAVATADTAIDYVAGGVAAVPEPDALWMLGAGLIGISVWRRRAIRV